MTMQIVSLLEARERLREIQREHPTDSDVDKALTSAILSIEVAWSLIEANAASDEEER